MKWYEEKETGVSKNQPIVNFNCDAVELLLPCLKEEGSYITYGYNWFNITTGEWSSCCFFSTVEAAIQNRAMDGEIRNGDINIAKCL